MDSAARAQQAPYQLAANPAVSKYVRELQTNPKPYIRADAAKQLGILKDAAALEQLHKSLVTDTFVQVRINSANAIARINRPASVDRLITAFATNERIDVQLAIIRALGDMRQNSLKIVPKLVRLLKSNKPLMREATVEALWKIRSKDPRVVHVLNQLLAQETELIVKLTLTHVIADFKSPESVPVLISILKRTDEHVDVKGLAQEALDKLAQMGVASSSATHVSGTGGGH